MQKCVGVVRKRISECLSAFRALFGFLFSGLPAFSPCVICSQLRRSIYARSPKLDPVLFTSHLCTFGNCCRLLPIKYGSVKLEEIPLDV